MCWSKKISQASCGLAVPSSAQLEVDVYYLVACQLILTHLADADTAYFTQFPCRAGLQLRNKLSRVVGGWVGGWVGGAAGEMENKAKLNLNWV